MGTIKIPLHSRKYPNLYALIDEEDYEIVSQHRWNPAVQRNRSAVYATTNIRENGKKRSVSMHTLILNTPSGMAADHIDGDGLNNTRSNLRIVTLQQNNYNRTIHADNTSGYKGVCFHKHTDMWVAQLSYQGRRVLVEYFHSAEDAARRYDEKAIEVFGEFARTNVMLGLLRDDK